MKTAPVVPLDWAWLKDNIPEPKTCDFTDIAGPRVRGTKALWAAYVAEHPSRTPGPDTDCVEWFWIMTPHELEWLADNHPSPALLAELWDHVYAESERRSDRELVARALAKNPETPRATLGDIAEDFAHDPDLQNLVLEHDNASEDWVLAAVIRLGRQVAMPEIRAAGASIPGGHMPHADLRGADLRGADMSDAYAPWANFAGADCTSASFRYADLHQANFAGAVLIGTDFTGAMLDGADFTGAIVDGAETNSAYFGGSAQ